MGCDAVQPRQRRFKYVGARFRMLGVVGGGDGIHQIFDVQASLMSFELLLMCGGRKRNQNPVTLQSLEELAHFGKGFRARKIVVHEELDAQAFQVCTKFLQLVLRKKDGHQLIGALAHMLVNVFEMYFLAVVLEGFPPRFDMELVGIDERPIDIEYRGFDQGGLRKGLKAV
jgi:hypothetical protein